MHRLLKLCVVWREPPFPQKETTPFQKEMQLLSLMKTRPLCALPARDRQRTAQVNDITQGMLGARALPASQGWARCGWHGRQRSMLHRVTGVKC